MTIHDGPQGGLHPPGSLPQAIGVPWFRRADWARWGRLDPALQADYDTWLATTEQRFRQVAQAGYPLEKVEVRPQPFLAWCAATPQVAGQVESDKRAAFAAALLGAAWDRRQQH